MTESGFDVLKQIRTHIDRINPVLPSQLALTVGQFAFKALRNPKRFNGIDTPTLLHILHRKELDLKTVEITPDPASTLMFDTVFEPHYWFDIHSYLDGNEEFSKSLDETIFDYHDEVVISGSLSDGVTAGVLPTLNSKLVRDKKNAVFLAVFPSMDYSSDALFNAFSSLGLLLGAETGPIILLDNTRLSQFIGVNRGGGRLSNGDIVDFLVELFLDKRGLIRDLVKQSNSFKVDMFTALLAAGASLEIYESLRNILDITLEQPLLDFDLSTAQFVYVLVRAPLRLQYQLPKGYIELEVNSWLKDVADLNAPLICEPVYVEEHGDRIDVVVLVGGFETGHLFETMDKRISRFSTLIVEHELYEKEIWGKIRKTLLDNTQRKIQES